jgi:hypothetical protein
MLGAITDLPGISTALEYIQGKAKEGAEGAIPEIQAQVQTVVKPYVITAILISGTGLVVSLLAYREARKARSGKALAGRSGRRR